MTLSFKRGLLTCAFLVFLIMESYLVNNACLIVQLELNHMLIADVRIKSLFRLLRLDVCAVRVLLCFQWRAP